MEKLLVTVEEAVEATGMSRSHLYKEMTAKRIESVRLGRRRLIPADVLYEYVEELRNRAQRAGRP